MFRNMNLENFQRKIQLLQRCISFCDWQKKVLPLKAQHKEFQYSDSCTLTRQWTFHKILPATFYIHNILNTNTLCCSSMAHKHHFIFLCIITLFPQPINLCVVITILAHQSKFLFPIYSIYWMDQGNDPSNENGIS